MSSGPSRKTVSLAWGADPTRFRVPDRRARKGEFANVQERSQLNWFRGKRRGSKSRSGQQHEFHRAQPGDKRELEKQTNE
jgi:hypothetical protein